MSNQYIQLNYLDKMSGGDPNTRKEMLLMLVHELESSGPRMRSLWESQDYSSLQWLTHHLKSTFPFVGNAQLDRTNRELEQHLRQGRQLDAVGPMVDEIVATLPKVLMELKVELSKT